MGDGGLRRAGRLWCNRNFLRLWAGQTVSFVGSQVTSVALPLTAALYLDATPAQMGLLTAAGTAPYLLLGPLAGVWVDRMRRRPILVVADLARGTLIGLIPLLHLLGILGMEILIVIMFGVGTCTVIFDLAYQSYLPSLVEHDDLMEGNSKLMTSRAVADVGGPGLAGMLVQLVTAPFALLLNALSFAVSAASVLLIRMSELRPPPNHDSRSLWSDMVDGLRFTLGDTLLRAGAIAAATYNFCWSAIQAVLVLYVVGQLGVSPGVFGLTLSVGAVGALLGSVLTAPISHRFGVGPATVGCAALSCAPQLLLPLIGDASTGVALLGLTFFLRGLGLSGWNVQIESLQQATVPSRMMGRMNGSYLLLSQGAGSVGALIGGLLGSTIGLRPMLAVGAAGVSLAWLWLLFSPLRTLAALPQRPEESSVRPSFTWRGPGGLSGTRTSARRRRGNRRSSAEAR